jgi:predicted small integral membrane protein
VADNLMDYGSNWQFVQHVLSMDTTFPNSKLHWRAITDPVIQQVVYWLIIATQFATAALLWLGALCLLAKIRAANFMLAKTLAVAGLTLGLLLYVVGFVTIGGEWFAMWQSVTWNGQAKAFSFISTTAAVLIVLLMPEEPG